MVFFVLDHSAVFGDRFLRSARGYERSSNELVQRRWLRVDFRGTMERSNVESKVFKGNYQMHEFLLI